LFCKVRRNPFECQVFSDTIKTNIHSYHLNISGRNPFECQVFSDLDSDLLKFYGVKRRNPFECQVFSDINPQAVLMEGVKVAIPSNVRSFPI